MKKGTILLTTYNSEFHKAPKVEIEALIHECGLAVHKDPDSIWYTVTHIQSGRKVLQARQLKMAKLAIEKLAPLDDWNVEVTETTQLAILSQKVREVKGELGL